MIVTVHIRAGDIAAKCHSPDNCPAALAINRLLCAPYIAMVHQHRVTLQKAGTRPRIDYSDWHDIDSPLELKKFVMGYDMYPESPPDPISFELDIPEKYLLEAA